MELGNWPQNKPKLLETSVSAQLGQLELSNEDFGTWKRFLGCKIVTLHVRNVSVAKMNNSRKVHNPDTFRYGINQCFLIKANIKLEVIV